MRLESSQMGLNVGVVEGTSSTAMRAGAGHFIRTPLPGQPGNVVVLGDTHFYGRPFYRLAKAKPGERVTARLNDGRAFIYAVTPRFDGHGNPWTVISLGPDVTGQGGALGAFEWLTLVSKPIGHTPVTVVRLERTA
jgi:sortase (surface protein transpeptidase)